MWIQFYHPFCHSMISFFLTPYLVFHLQPRSPGNPEVIMVRLLFDSSTQSVTALFTSFDHVCLVTKCGWVYAALHGTHSSHLLARGTFHIIC